MTKDFPFIAVPLAACVLLYLILWGLHLLARYIKSRDNCGPGLHSLLQILEAWLVPLAIVDLIAFFMLIAIDTVFQLCVLYAN